MGMPSCRGTSVRVNQLIRSGYLYELAGLVYYVYFLLMSRGRNAARFSQRSRVLTLITAIALVGTVPLHYGGSTIALAVIAVLVLASAVSSIADRRGGPPR